jgi:TatD DNase family protein
MIIDTHSHLQFDAYDSDREEVIKRTLAQNIQCINVGCSLASSEGAVELAQKHEGFFAAIGLHPTDVDEALDIQNYRELAQSKKVVAIGEIGLDFFRKPHDQQKQKEVFLQQLALAKELNLPVIIHCRAAHEEVIDILKLQITNHKLQGVIHCFTGTLEQAQQYIEMGFCLGIGGIIFKFNIDEVIKNIGLEHLLLETDCPYLTPLPEAGKRNEPVFIKHTIQKIAELKGVSFEKVCKTTTQTAKALFRM